MMTPLETAKEYQRRGWQPLPIAHRSKNPNFTDRQNFKPTEADLPKHFTGAAQNIGVLVGRRSNGLTDIDLDSPESNKIADYFLPKTESEFGRANTPRSHRLYVCAEEIYEKFNNPFLLASKNKAERDKACIVEFRGKEGFQTVFPGRRTRKVAKLSNGARTANRSRWTRKLCDGRLRGWLQLV